MKLPPSKTKPNHNKNKLLVTFGFQLADPSAGSSSIYTHSEHTNTVYLIHIDGMRPDSIHMIVDTFIYAVEVIPLRLCWSHPPPSTHPCVVAVSCIYYTNTVPIGISSSVTVHYPKEHELNSIHPHHQHHYHHFSTSLSFCSTISSLSLSLSISRYHTFTV